jgi:hypothetical protein
LTVSADLKILKQPNHVKQLRIFSTIFDILKTLPMKEGIKGSRVVSYEKRKIWKSVFLVLKHRFLPLSKPLPLLRGEALKEDFNFLCLYETTLLNPPL